jgi:hypothetical protein
LFLYSKTQAKQPYDRLLLCLCSKQHAVRI